MKFDSWSKERIRNGKKSITSRKVKYVNDPDVHCVLPALPWWFICRFLFRAEGARSPKELQGVINRIFRRTVLPDEMFYVHVLKADLEV